MFTGLKELYIAWQNNLIAHECKMDKTQNNQFMDKHFQLFGKTFENIEKYVADCHIGYSIRDKGFALTKLGMGYGCFHETNPYRLNATLYPNHDLKFAKLGAIHLSLFDKTRTKSTVNYVCTLKGNHMDTATVKGNTPKHVVQRALKQFQKINKPRLLNNIKFYKQRITHDNSRLDKLLQTVNN